MNDKLDIPRLMELAERGSGKFGQDVANAVTELLSARERIAELERDYAKCILSKGRKPDSADVVKQLREMHEFLRGAGTLDGCAFGEKPIGATGNYWWRKPLGIAIEAAISLLIRGTNDEL